MVSQTAEYALRTIIWLASSDDVPLTTQQIAEATRVPPGYLAKILQSLGRAGLVKSQRGIKGGFVLVGDPHSLTPWDVVKVIDPVRRIEQCPLGLENHRSVLCPLHRKLDAAMAQIETALAGVTIADLVEEAGGKSPFCGS